MNFILKLWKKTSFIILIIFLIAGIFDPRLALIALICMIGPILMSVSRGRFWCGNICPRGSFYDNVAAVLSIGRQVPAFLKWMPFRYAIVIFLLGTFGKGLKQNWGDLTAMGMVFYRIVAITTMIGIVLSLFFNERAWCSLCPMGTLSNLVSQLNDNRRVLKVDSSCTSCKICKRTCPMGVSPFKFKNQRIDHPDCIQCGKCIVKCPKKSIGYKR